mmetsp:Transcript_15092/g.35958  ORF Transcript_15092/g.35958 Transcript_15092/m.35958 type:complete len:265 (+) Transcript_15092:426-1220(+)
MAMRAIDMDEGAAAWSVLEWLNGGFTLEPSGRISAPVKSSTRRDGRLGIGPFKTTWTGLRNPSPAMRRCSREGRLGRVRRPLQAICGIPDTSSSFRDLSAASFFSPSGVMPWHPTRLSEQRPGMPCTMWHIETSEILGHRPMSRVVSWGSCSARVWTPLSVSWMTLLRQSRLSCGSCATAAAAASLSCWQRLSQRHLSDESLDTIHETALSVAWHAQLMLSEVSEVRLDRCEMPLSVTGSHSLMLRSVSWLSLDIDCSTPSSTA